jgi:uncharacterized secreted protein with C-terminal beta-propeller domain
VRKPVFAIYIDKRRLATYTVLAFILGGVLGGVMWNFGGGYVPKLAAFTSNGLGPLSQFSSLEELSSFLGRTQIKYYFDVTGQGFIGDLASLPSDLDVLSDDRVIAAATAAANAAGEFVVTDYSGTNVQVTGVDEADLVKTDGEYIYLARGNEVLIVKAYPIDNVGLVKRMEFQKKVIELYASGDKLVVFLKMNSGIYEDLIGVTPQPNFNATTTIQVYDISNKEAPVMEREVEVDGSYFNSRMIGNYVYVIIRKNAKMNDNVAVLPSLKSEGQSYSLEPSDIYYVNTTDQGYRFTHILALNAQNPEEDVTIETLLLGKASNLYVSLGNIYITTRNRESVQGFAPPSLSHTTKIHKISINKGEISYVAGGEVPGEVLNQFSMSESRGYFRIATTSGRVSRSGGGTSNNLYVLNSTMGIAGSLEGLAPGEKIYSARFMGDRCYLVTFKKVDPLFVIDLEDPENPKVLGKLKIPGYSDYLHPYDENTLIGIGKETVEAEEGNFAWYQGVKISLFDVSDVSDPKELAKYEIGDRGTDSPALYDHKAFLFSLRRNLLVIPVLEAEIDSSDYSGLVPSNAHGDYVYQGAYIFNISPEDGIQLRGRVTHVEDPQDFLKSGYWFESDLSVERSLYIEDVLYTFSYNLIKMNSLIDLNELDTVDLT